MVKVVIIGGGFGGVTSALNLIKHKNIDVTLFNKSEGFLFTPLIADVISGKLKKRDIIFDIKKNLGSKIKAINKEVDKVDFQKKKIYYDSSNIEYDYIIIAIGAKENYFGIDGAKENCLKLKTVYDTNDIQIRIQEALIDDKKENSFVVVGAGATGIELAVEIKDRIDYYKKKTKQKSNLKVLIIDGNDKILGPINNDKIRSIVMKKLLKKNIDIKFNSRVTKITKNYVEINGNEKIITDNVFWAAGVKPNTILTEPEIVDKSGHFQVNEYLKIKGIENAYSIGDCASFIQEDKPLPDFAQVAVKQAKIVSYNIINEIKNKNLKKFHYNSEGFILSMGNTAVAEVKGIIISGKLAWIMHKIVYSIKRIGLKNQIRTFIKLIF
ncbi:FAD-dependent oxidoreductase [archaeon]|nr:FAD-dependent oxidoreductase [archaeon]